MRSKRLAAVYPGGVYKLRPDPQRELRRGIKTYGRRGNWSYNDFLFSSESRVVHLQPHPHPVAAICPLLAPYHYHLTSQAHRTTGLRSDVFQCQIVYALDYDLTSLH